MEKHPTGIQKAEEEIIYKEGIQSFSVIGDPGCEGLGTSMMQVYSSALQEASQDGLILVAGDLVPVGSAKYYQRVCQLTHTAAEKEVYVLRGNHDTGAFTDYFGRQEYALHCGAFTIIILDNASRKFTEKGLEMLSRILSMSECANAVIAFHIPLPNRFTKNSVSQQEFARLQAAYQPWKEKVKYFVCGHVHSRFVGEADGIPLVCTGGGGAMIEDVSEEIKAADVDHHIVRFRVENGALRHEIVDLSDIPYRKESSGPILRERLSETVAGELMAHLRYLTFAERAEKRGYRKIGTLFRALAESEYRHARSFFSVLNQPKPFTGTISDFVAGEEFEHQRLYPMMEEYAQDHHYPLSGQAYENACAAEKVHSRLLKGAERLEDGDISRETLYVCAICGYLMEGKEKPERCPICGASSKQFLSFDTETGEEA